MKKALLGLILILLGAAAGIFGWTAGYVRDRQEQTEYEAARDIREQKEAREPQKEEPQEEAPGEENRASESGELSLEHIAAGRLAYDLLDETAQKAYLEMLEMIDRRQEETVLSITDAEALSRAYQALTSDCGGLFWVNGYTYKQATRQEEVVELRFLPTYTFDEEDTELYQGYVDEVVRDYFAGLPEGATDYEKVKYVYEMLIYNVEYDAQIDENQNILSVFLWGRSVCSGFASAAQYLLTLLDVPAMTVYGTSEGIPHAWNLVCIDGEPYFLDATWGNTASASIGACSYSYLNMTSRDIENTHRIDMEIELPSCTSVTDSYYAREGLYFTVYNEAAIGEALREGLESGAKATELKCASQEVYRQALQSMIEEQKLAEYCPGLQSIRYVENDSLHVLALIWE